MQKTLSKIKLVRKKKNWVNLVNFFKLQTGKPNKLYIFQGCLEFSKNMVLKFLVPRLERGPSGYTVKRMHII